MKALVFQAIGRLGYVDCPDPEILEAGDAIVRVRFCGVCGSDLHILQGREVGIASGTIFGHELSGEIVACGSDVQHFSVGDAVCCPFTTNCGDCFFCNSELTCRCPSGQVFGWLQDGKGLQGSHAEYVRVPMADSTLMALPEGVSFEDAVLLADNLSTGFYCADLAGIAERKRYVLLGCGTVGLSTLIAARHKGAVDILAVDQIEYRRKRAIELGATAVYPPEEAAAAVEEYTSGIGADAVFDAVGSIQAQTLAYQVVRPGGTIATAGVQTATNFGFTPIEAYDKNISFRVGRCPARHYMREIAPLVAEKQIAAGQLITHRLPLSEGIEAYKLFAARESGLGKVLLDPTR